jgi:hypothetical protein
MALPLLELPPIEKGRPVAGRPFCVVEKRVAIVVMEVGILVDASGGSEFGELVVRVEMSS